MSTRSAKLSALMELNGYGYLDFTAKRSDIELPYFKTAVTDGEFILNLYDGRN